MSDTIQTLDLDVPIGDEFDGFAVFVVGGAVRDAVRGVEPADVDLMAVPRPSEVDNPVAVLRDRMVMVDPESTIPVFADSHGREVALPRTEQDTGAGHRDFDMAVVPAGTPVEQAVETDLARRDLTANAMAMNARTGAVFDPHGGMDDLNAGVVRHVSAAFREDPLRVVRLARFAPRLDARVADETMALAQSIPTSRLESLPVERVTNELRKVVSQATDAGRFVRILDTVGALDDTFPVLAAHDTDAVARTMTAARNATTDDRLGAVVAALGDLLGDDASYFATAADLTNHEVATLRTGRDVLDQIARFDELPPRDAVEVFERVDSERVADPQAFVAAATARHPNTNPTAVNRQLDRVAAVFENVTGSDVIEQEGVTPAEDIDGEAFGELLADRRASRL